MYRMRNISLLAELGPIILSIDSINISLLMELRSKVSKLDRYSPYGT